MKFKKDVSIGLFKIFHLKLFLCLIFGLGFFSSVNAQFTCKDSLPINPYFQCSQTTGEFQPVCGCTQKTYRNDCVRLNVYGVRTAVSGVCKNDVFYYDVYPNPSVEKITFDILFFEQVNYSNYTVQIFDTYGKLMYFEHKANVKSGHNDIYLIGFRPGMYVFTIISGSVFKTKKLIVK